MADYRYYLLCKDTTILETGGCDKEFEFGTSQDLKSQALSHYPIHKNERFSDKFSTIEDFEKIDDSWVNNIKGKLREVKI